MDRQVGGNSPDHPQQSQVLYEHPVGPRLGNLTHDRFQRLQLVGKRQRIQRHITPHAAAMQKCQQIRQVVYREPGRPRPGVERTVQAKIERICPIRHGRPRAVPIPYRGKQFRWGRQGSGHGIQQSD